MAEPALLRGLHYPGRCWVCRFLRASWDGLAVDLGRVLFREVKSQAADREVDDFMTVPRSRPG